MNHSSPVQLNRKASSQGNIVVSDACDKIGRLSDEDTTTERLDVLLKIYPFCVNHGNKKTKVNIYFSLLDKYAKILEFIQALN